MSRFEDSTASCVIICLKDKGDKSNQRQVVSSINMSFPPGTPVRDILSATVLNSLRTHGLSVRLFHTSESRTSSCEDRTFCHPLLLTNLMRSGFRLARNFWWCTSTDYTHTLSVHLYQEWSGLGLCFLYIFCIGKNKRNRWPLNIIADLEVNAFADELEYFPDSPLALFRVISTPSFLDLNRN